MLAPTKSVKPWLLLFVSLVEIVLCVSHTWHCIWPFCGHACVENSLDWPESADKEAGKNFSLGLFLNVHQDWMIKSPHPDLFAYPSSVEKRAILHPRDINFQNHYIFVCFLNSDFICILSFCTTIFVEVQLLLF